MADGPEVCPNGHPIGETSQFCQLCGVRARCGNGHVVPTLDAGYCEICGVSLEDAASTGGLGGPGGGFNEPTPSAAPNQAPPGHGLISTGPYPTRFEIDYPGRLSRWKTGFRVILILPVFLVLYVFAFIGYAAMFAGWITVFLRRSYPPWLMAAHTGFLGFYARTTAYQTLLTDQYPSFSSGDGPVRLSYPQPEPGSLSRWRVFLWKSVLIIPHLIVLWFLSLAITVVTILAWFAVLFTGQYPRGMFAFVVGVQRWSFRLHGYFASFHDEYPPFSLSEESVTADRSTTVIAGIVGGVVAAGVAVLITVATVLSFRAEVVDVDYAGLERGFASERLHFAERDSLHVHVQLLTVADDSDQYSQLLRPSRDQRVIVFVARVDLFDGVSFIKDNDASLKFETRDGERDSVGATVIEVDDREAPRHIEEGDRAEVILVFVVPIDAMPVSLSFDPDFAGEGGIRYDFE